MKKNIDLGQLGIVLAIVAVAASVVLSRPSPEAAAPGADFAAQGVTNFDSIHLSDSGGTATPILLLDQSGAGAIAEFRDAGTPVARFADGGGLAVISGNTTLSDSGGTATPVLAVDQSGTGAIAEFRDAGTPVARFSDGGGLTVISGNTDLAGTLNYGANDLYPVGFASSGQQIVYGTSDITGTLVAPHGLTTVTYCMAVMGEDPTAGAGDAAHVTVTVAANVCTLKAWQDDFVTAATETEVAVHWAVIGAP